VACESRATIKEQGRFVQLSAQANEPFRHFKLDARGSGLALLPALLSRFYPRLQTADFGLQRSCEYGRLRNLAGSHGRLTAYVGTDADGVEHALYISDRVTSSQLGCRSPGCGVDPGRHPAWVVGWDLERQFFQTGE
jgi:hypothetical protein